MEDTLQGLLRSIGASIARMLDDQRQTPQSELPAPLFSSEDYNPGASSRPNRIEDRVAAFVTRDAHDAYEKLSFLQLR